MKADDREYRTLSSATGNGKAKGRRLVFSFSILLSFLFHLGVMAAVIYGVNGVGDSPRMITLEITFVEESIDSPIPVPRTAEARTNLPEKEKDAKLAMNKSAASIPPDPEQDKPQKEPQAAIPPIQGTAQSSVIPLVKDIKKRIQVSPQYPKMAIRRGYEGTVIIHALVNRKGTIDTLKIVSSSGYDILDDAATTAVGQWAFDMHSPLAPKIWVEVPVRFVLSEVNK